MAFSRSIFVAALAVAGLAAQARGGTIHDAAKEGNVDEVKRLVAADSSLLELQDESGTRPLHWAAFAGKTEVIKFLLERGAAIDPADYSGSTPLHYAVYMGEV